MKTRGIRFIALTGAICSILGFISGSIWKLPIGYLGISYLCFSISLCILLVLEGRNKSKFELMVQDLDQQNIALNNKIKDLEHKHHIFEKSMDSLHDVFHSLRDCYCLLQNDGDNTFGTQDNDKFLMELKNALDKAKIFFNDIYHINCSVCIKLITNKNTLEVMTLMRDSKSQRSRRKQDAIPTYVGNHFAFHKIIIDRERHFFSADFIADEKKDNFYGRPNWQKDYKSGAVLPIKKDKETLEKDAKKNIPEYLGFLCLDTKKRKVLSEDFTVSTLAAIADILYIVCKRYRRLTTKNERRE